jgi:hypothetical protein
MPKPNRFHTHRGVVVAKGHLITGFLSAKRCRVNSVNPGGSVVLCGLPENSIH